MGNLANFATSLVATAPSPATSGTSLVVTAAQGTRYPAVPFYATAHPKNEVPTFDNAEAVLVTARSTDTFTITRAQKGTTAKTITTDFRISNTIFTEDMFNGSVVENEVPTGSVNGSNTTFTVATAGKVTGTLKVYKNGVRLKAGGADFTETATGFTMVTAPVTGTVLLCDYRVGGVSDYNVGSNSFISDEAVTGSVNSSNTSYTTARQYIAGSLEVFINGLKQIRTTDYAETTPASGIFTMTVAPTTGDLIRVNYQYNLNPSSNADTVDGFHATSLIGQVKVQKFAATGTYTPDAKMLYCIIECWGGGGGGGNNFATSAANIYASGGGGGGYSKKYATVADIGASKAVTIGAGGAGNASGSTSVGNTVLGGDTSVGTLCIAKGGGNGGYVQHGVQVSNVGLGGSTSGSAGDITAPGISGGLGLYGGGTGPQTASGSGGNTVLGGAGAGVVDAAGSAAVANTGSGGGGSGQYSGSNTARAGGAGGSGYVVVTEFCQP